MALGYVSRERGDGMMRMTEVEAQALAAFLGRVRPDWDHPGIMAALKKATHLGSSAAVAAAACRLAENLELRTPAILEKPGPHWGGTTVATRQTPSMCPEHPGEKAGQCLETGPCSQEVVPIERGQLKALVAAATPRRQVTHKHPTPPATDVRAAREAIDTQEPQP